MTFTLLDWHNRFLHQAHWTQDLRNYIYEHAGLSSARRVLEVGSGTGVLLSELKDRSSAFVLGIDNNSERLAFASSSNPPAEGTLADAHNLPLKSASFDLTLCHFLLLWVTNPVNVVTEMARVTKPGGAVIALAEPDYGGRIDYPDELATLSKWQSLSLRSQGADPLIGRRLPEIFWQAGIHLVQFGVLGGQWNTPLSQNEWENEWDVLQSDLEGIMNHNELQNIRSRYREAWNPYQLVLFIPTFYAWGYVAN
jgi:SAM-dependent methyltransferase